MKFAKRMAFVCVTLAAACQPVTEMQRAASLPPDQACLALASESFEVTNGIRGKRLDKINHITALPACEAATQANPGSSRLLAAYSRALFADARLRPDSEADAAYDRALEAMHRAADAGDALTAALLIANHDYVGRYSASQIIANSESLLAQLLAQPTGNVRDDIAILVLEGAVYTGRARQISDIPDFEEELRVWDAYSQPAEARLMAQLMAAGQRVGWLQFNDFLWEIRRAGDFCNWQGQACMIFGNGLEYAKDARAALAASIDSLTEAYRSHDIAMSKLASSSQDEIEIAMHPGQSLADEAGRYAGMASKWGGDPEKKAAADIDQAIEQFFDYRNRTVANAQQRVQAEEAGRWIAVATLIFGAVALYSHGQSGAPSTAYDWAAEQGRIDCDAAKMHVAIDAAHNQDSHPYWSARAAGC